MNVIIDDTDSQYLEYNTLGGVLDFYFVSGPSPVNVAQQYSELVGKSDMMPYWGFGFHQCRYGMQDVYEVAEVVANYSLANIPLEKLWTDIDYMYLRRIFTLDPDRFPLHLMQELVTYLHNHNRHYIVMVDPAVSNGSVYKGVVWPGVTSFPNRFAPGTQGYWNDEFDTFFNPGTGIDIDALWIDMNEASNLCVFPCTNPENQATTMGDPPRPPAVRLGAPRPNQGFPADFQPVCHTSLTFSVTAYTFFGENIVVFGSAITIGSGTDLTNAVTWLRTIIRSGVPQLTCPPTRQSPSSMTITTGGCGSTSQTGTVNITTSSLSISSKARSHTLPEAQGAPIEKRQASGHAVGLPGRDLLNPEYINPNEAGSISNETLNTDLIRYGGYAEYDTHKLYGAMMSEASRLAMLSRRPTLRLLVITRSTLADSGRQVKYWLGDNDATWTDYLISIASLLEFGALFQVPIVGSDVCGYADVTNELLCARWATLGAFRPSTVITRHLGSHRTTFTGLPRHGSGTQRDCDEIPFLGYIYTAFYDQNQTGTPTVQPMFFVYPETSNANSLGHQYFYGPGIMVAPVTVENSTTTEIYIPDDIFYDYFTHETVRGHGEMVTLTDVAYTTIALYYKGGSIVALRANSANTTTDLRKEDFSIVIAPSLNGTASGSLYLDDGVSIEQAATSYIEFSYDASGHFGCFDHQHHGARDEQHWCKRGAV
ncbi:hypothetical protein LTR49_025674 [Elasticomyces elasticus]|nr:hypothetical protein LTR49_025674 [Elasticomyces elasticus]